MFFKKKKIDVPVSNEIKEIEVIDTWILSWENHFPSYGGTIIYKEKQYLVFTNEQEARETKDALEKAALLLKDKGRIITLENR